METFFLTLAIIIGIIVVVSVVLAGITAWIFKVPYLPSRKLEAEEALSLMELKPGQVFYDLGCGDGKMLLAAAKKGARAYGWEVHPYLWLLSKIRVGQSAKVALGSFWRVDCSKADVIYAFLMPVLMVRVEQEIWPTMKRGAKLVSNFFPLPSIKPTEVSGKVFLYVK